MKRLRASAALLLALTVAVGAPVALAKDPPGQNPVKFVQIQLLALNDFHGNLEPPAGSGGRIGATLAGGVEYLATHVQELRATNPNTLFLSAGDMIGATPLLSALFHDEPTIEAFNLMGLDYNGVGNHEFDEGVDELLRMQNGGCHPVDGCRDGDGFAGAEFDFLAANVKYKSNGETIFAPYDIVEMAGVKIGIIGMTLEQTPSIVSPAGISHVDFLDEAETVNALVPELEKQGVKTIVVLLHQGGTTSDPLNESTINSCGTLEGPLPPIVEAFDEQVDVVITGHTNWAVNCVIDGKVVTGAAHQGRLVTDIDLTINTRSGNVMAGRTLVNNRIVTRTVAKDPAQTALIAKYQAVAAPFANRIIGTITADILRAQNTAGESRLGDRIADAQNFDAQQAGTGSQIAFMNAGGIRADLIYASSPAGEGDGNVTYGEAFAVQPFGNSLVTMTLTGAQIKALLEQQFTGGIGILQVSEGFSYTYTVSAPAGSKVSSIMLNGSPVDPATNYRVTVNSFLADGGDNYAVLVDGTNRIAGNVDTDAFENYLLANPGGITPGPQNRITRIE
ncbi:MAG: bifunctional metallophosphatase/5'-nucleotidase [Chloroflexota bacterium]